MHQLTHQRIGKSLVVGLLLPLVAIVAAGTDPIAHAADQVVTSMTDGGEPGTLRAAFEAVNASGGGVITVPAGTITLTSALPALTQSTTVVGAGAGETIIDTDGYRFIYSTASVEIHVEAVTLTGNTSSAQGAMIYRQSGTTTLERVEVTGNSGASFLGIIFQQQGGVLQLVDSAVHNNAGGIFGSDHGNTPSDDTIASPLADSAYANRLYITSSVDRAVHHDHRLDVHRQLRRVPRWAQPQDDPAEHLHRQRYGDPCLQEHGLERARRARLRHHHRQRSRRERRLLDHVDHELADLHQRRRRDRAQRHPQPPEHHHHQL